jgi:hypothetical protein
MHSNPPPFCSLDLQNHPGILRNANLGPMRTTLILLLLVCVAANEPALARDETSRDEIEFLLRHVENSSVRFVRGGKEYSPKEAADHLRYKLAHAGGRVKTAEDFIAGIATKSYLTGRA